MTPYTIGYLRGGSFGAEFDAATYLKKEDVTENEQNIKKLVAGRIDLIIAHRLLILYLLKTKYPEWQNEIEFIDPSWLLINVHHAISRTNPNAEKIVADFNRGLQAIKDDGTYQKIQDTLIEFWPMIPTIPFSEPNHAILRRLLRIIAPIHMKAGRIQMS